MTKEALVHVLKYNEPNIFATWNFYEADMQYSPVVQGPMASFECSALYKVRLTDCLLDYFADQLLQVDVHMVLDEPTQDCKQFGTAHLKLS